MRVYPILAALLLCASVLPARAAEEAMAAHRALYQLTLESTRGGDVVAAAGSMAYEVIDACDGWAVRQRLKMTLTNREGQDIEMLSDYVTWEAKDGLSLRFQVRQTTETAVTSETKGEASLEGVGAAGAARYTVPEVTTKALPAGTLFPMAHTAAIIAAARAGQKILAVPVFDGTVAGGAQDSTIAILNWKPPEPSRFAVLGALPSTRVRIAFFDRDAGTTTPDYEVGMRYWANGIADDLHMDFGDFVMNGTLTDLTLPKPGC